MKYKKNWNETQEKFNNYWKHQNTGRPLMIVVAEKEGAVPLPDELRSKDMEDKYCNPARMVASYRHYCENHEFLGESFPNINADFGPGSIAAYLGSDIEFKPDTIWFTECVEDWEEHPPLTFDPENHWFQKHIQLYKDILELADGDFLVPIPDLMENIDVLVSMRGGQNIVYDMIDDPEIVEERLQQVTDVYFSYYDSFYNLIKDPADDSCAYTVFQIWGKGKTAKIQCDFSALMSPTQFRDFIQEPLRQQAKQLDNTLYHLDGPDAIRHLDALMEIDEIDALQWTSGDHGPDGTMEEWYEIYDKARDAGKSLWVKVYTGNIDDWICNADRIVQRYGSHSLLLYFNPLSKKDAEKLMAYAEEHWKDVKGTYQPRS